jgi:hypothetical protein
MMNKMKAERKILFGLAALMTALYLESHQKVLTLAGQSENPWALCRFT